MVSCFLGSIHGIGKLLASSAVIHTFDSKYTKYTVNYFVAEEYSSESHFPQSDCASIESQIEYLSIKIIYCSPVQTIQLACARMYR